MKTFRIDVAASLLVPVSCASVILLYCTGFALLQPIIMASVLLFAELYFLRETDSDSSFDKGIKSGFLVSCAISIVMLLQLLICSDVLLQVIGSFMILSGVGLRAHGKIILGRHFSHSLRVLVDHELVKDGAFRCIRHPAYFGTLLIVTGFGLYTSIYAALVVFFVALLLILKRVGNEEKMLVEYFGEKYVHYQFDSYKVIPFII
ncbi:MULTISPECIES: isoprenylcysteine carboxylmethyltransferase family protein [Pseudomonas]|uniref:Isoprenylcysteine carboxylmethyltransferase family protein n=1 Tax=Pseudomonas wuhanensis TaxID=2954098 RepID=A0ABY9GZS6_9PSED|nr:MULTISPECIES: isoprenylcysteine carboxylmethyltransferase family protein [unclassified Pseudomonas]WLI15332.1 isoprenylcysteine carboxylmethyltransferase family protein [Pseudomonas sp. FP603]WLI21006.1 isoprenylcysteine carboxylmethyltransferase family protein [Pseudomonas sp. FP607]